MSDITTTRRTARRVIDHLGQYGTPPEIGVECFSVGIRDYLDTIRKEYLEDLVAEGISTFKLLVGSYGGGKTHFLYALRNLASELGYVVAYVPLSPAECPFNRMDMVYRSIFDNLQYPLKAFDLEDEEPAIRGIEPFLRYMYRSLGIRLDFDITTRQDPKAKIRPYMAQITGIESISFQRAMTEAFTALAEQDEDRFLSIAQWLKGEGRASDALRGLGIVENVDHRSAFRMLRSLAQWLRQVGFKGIAVLFDEAERALSLAATRQAMAALDHLRQWIDECGQSRFPGVFTVYAVPDELMLTDRPGPSYEALRQRLQTVFSIWEPTGIKINLEHLEMEPETFLNRLGHRLLNLYQRAYKTVLPPDLTETNIQLLAHRVYQTRYADISYRRLFVTSLIPLFHAIRRDPAFLLSNETAESWIVQQIAGQETMTTSESDRHEF